jgi:RNA polymerase sigma-70 factor (ECF subfamily)
VAAGDRQAFEVLYLYYWPQLLHFIRKQYPLLGEHIAEDVASESLARIWRDRSKLRAVKTLSAYLKTVARNIVARRFRGKRPSEVGLPTDIAASDPSPHEALERDELARQVVQTMETLVKLHRLALEASQSGLSAREIAARLGCTENAARHLVQKARKNLARALSRCGVDCAVDQGHPDECPAKIKNLHCLKSIYSSQLRSGLEEF